jgi:TRAP-type C4-dicarboxylate transport system permease small subunit
VERPDLLKQAARPFGFAAALILAFMMLFTTVAVAMRQFFDTPVLGVVDVMEFALVGLTFIAMPGVFLRDENVTVDVIDQLVSRRTRVALRLFGLIAALLFLAMTMIAIVPPAMEKFHSGEVTMTLSINRFYHWVPILFGFAMSIAASAWLLARHLRYGVPKDPILDDAKSAER